MPNGRMTRLILEGRYRSNRAEKNHSRANALAHVTSPAWIQSVLPTCVLPTVLPEVPNSVFNPQGQIGKPTDSALALGILPSRCGCSRRARRGSGRGAQKAGNRRSGRVCCNCRAVGCELLASMTFRLFPDTDGHSQIVTRPIGDCSRFLTHVVVSTGLLLSEDEVPSQPCAVLDGAFEDYLWEVLDVWLSVR